jgi:hypothetical protein
MKFSDKRNIVIAVLAAAFLCALFFALRKPEPAPYDETLVNTRINLLEQQNDQLLKDIAAERKKTTLFMFKIDSLEQRKPVVEIKYVKIYEKIDASHVDYVVSELDSVFSANSLK